MPAQCDDSSFCFLFWRHKLAFFRLTEPTNPGIDDEFFFAVLVFSSQVFYKNVWIHQIFIRPFQVN